jgi:nucleoid DNA-binding protein
VNKRQLIAAAARRSSLTQGQVREALEAIQEVIIRALADGDYVIISGFGRFDVQQYAGRKLRRFDGEGHYEVEDRWVPVFRSSKLLRQILRRDNS